MTSNQDQSLLAGGGEMGERIRAFDWSGTPLGPRRKLVAGAAHHGRPAAGQPVSHAAVVGTRLHFHL